MKRRLYLLNHGCFLPALAALNHCPIRCGAAMLGAEGNNPRRLAHRAVLERCVAPGRYVAEAREA
jgi:hypothetical protein